MRLGLVSVALTLASVPGALAWGAAGHEIIATIAQMHLHPDVLPVLCGILDPTSASEGVAPTVGPPCHLARIAAWADRVRMTPAYRHTATWHYVGAVDDAPGASCVFPGRRGWAGRKDSNVLAALGNQTRVVAGFLDGEGGLAEAADALKFLVHFAGDMHMPLHLTGRERGGNGAKVTFDGRMTNLHSVWDGFFIAQALRTIPANYSRPMLGGLEAHLRGAIYDGYVRRLMVDGFGFSVRDDGDDMRSAGEGRFGAVEEWLECPSDDNDNEDDDANDQSDDLAEHSWPIVQTVLRGIERTLGLGLEEHSGLMKRTRGVRRRRHRKHATRASGLWNWLWTGGKVGDEARWDDDVLCPYAWASAIHELNCVLPVWPAELDKLGVDTADNGHHCDMEDVDMDGAVGRPPRQHPELLELDTPEYAGRVREGWVVERLLAMAGIRLAGILNGLVLGDVNVHLH